ncbi:ATP-binding response regulator [Vampirovibrio chlorellavorus]|uniref:ATP-binding response regulator n=1 Tax=Vampirovibrio chlorellavorus TaxID=758823 RepID=UPI0026F17FCD|nr:hybrid sensor histidine kinase/response regulator [Vampirovibrio chlorellavorus]
MKLSSYLPRPPEAESELQPIRVLLVDDDEDEYIITRRIISEIIGRTHLLDWASSYAQGLALIEEANHDIYLIDYRLDEHTGLDLLQEAIAQGCTQPIILLTGQEDREVDIQAMKSGAWDYLVKDRIDAPMLERAIRYTLEHRKVLDVLLENQKQREKFVATLTHDLKTPIKAEFRIFELLLNERFGPITEEQSTVIQEMLRSNRFMYQMVDNLLTAFKFESGHMMLRMELIDVNELIASTVNLDLIGLAQEKNQELTLKLDANIPNIPVDGLEIKRVIYNLVQNAVNYTPKGGKIEIGTHLNENSVQITVADTGPGIEQTIQKTLFEPYASMAKRYRHIGTGLGLYISKKIIEAHQGILSVESELGKGSTFRFLLPLHQGEQSPSLKLF